MDAKYTGKTALHCAAAAGKVNVVEALVELRANLECEVHSSFTCMPTCTVHVWI